MAEAWAAIQVVLFCKELGFFDICLEGDFLQIVRECAIDLPNMSRTSIEGHKICHAVFLDGEFRSCQT
jgi:hypothetical protein